MAGALEQIPYTVVEGARTAPRLTVYAFSTCAFCKKAMEYLQEIGFGYRFVYMDQVDFDLKREAKRELKSKYQDLPAFPVLTIDDSRALSGFVKERWAQELGVQ